MSLLTVINSALYARYMQWIDRRLPVGRSITLDQRRIFIFPSRQGLWFLVLLLLMLLAAINYQNNMAFALVFLLASVFVVTILHTFANLSGLTIAGVRAATAFAGDSVEFELSVSRLGSRDYYDVTLHWPGSEVVSVTLKQQPEQIVRLHLPSYSRGLLMPPRLRVETFYPIGLLRAWTWIALDLETLVYPRPVGCKLVGADLAEQGEGELVPVQGSEDFYQFRQYIPGDSLKHVFWKSYAKGQPLQTKQFASYHDQRLWLDWQQFTGDVETRLSNICYWVLKLERSNDEYGIRLPGLEIAPGHGDGHRDQVLRELALFRMPVDAAVAGSVVNKASVVGAGHIQGGIG